MDSTKGKITQPQPDGNNPTPSGAEASAPDKMLYQEALRPQFHFSARQNWLNDPNGLVFYKGEYHLFFQHNPHGNEWGNMTWGHAVSRDLLHWKQLNPALEPDEMGTMFSGSAIVDHNNATGFGTGKEKAIVAIYTAAGGTSPASQGQPFTQCLAYSANRGRTWHKYARNPILKHIADGNRDPKVIWHEPTQAWIMALYLDKNDFALFASPDLKNWSHLHNLTLPGCEECPDFFPLQVEGSTMGTQWVFMAANGHYLVGSFDGRKFTPHGPAQPSDYGANFYAPQTYSDIPGVDGRRLQIAWMRGGKYPEMPFNQQMSFPCVLTLRQTAQGLRLYRCPAAEISKLVVKQQRWQNLSLKPTQNPLSGQQGELWDMDVEFELENGSEFGVTTRGATIRYNVAAQTLTCLESSITLEPVNNRIQLRLLVDRSSLEVFANDGSVSLTNTFHPAPNAPDLTLFVTGGTVKVVMLRVRALASAMGR